MHRHLYQLPPQRNFGGGTGTRTSYWQRREGRPTPVTAQVSLIPTFGRCDGGHDAPADLGPGSIESDTKRELFGERAAPEQYGYCPEVFG